MGRPDEAQSALRAAFKSDPQSATAAYNIGVILAGDRPAEAIEWCRKAHSLRPDEPKYSYTLAFYLYGQARAEEAVERLKIITNARVPYVDAYVLLGRIYEEQGRTDQAADVFQLAASLDEIPPHVRSQFAARGERFSRTKKVNSN